jgi:3' terminal RNA ribose 2'-O-methyltransferase Hen1
VIKTRDASRIKAMLLTITTTHRPATDLGYLLHKHPDRFQTLKIARGEAHVFYPEANEDRCTVALLMELDPVELVRGKATGDRQQFSLKQYVNDRPYVASSFMSVAMLNAFRTAMTGKCEGHEELAGTAIPLEARLSMVPCRGGLGLLGELFEPLGYEIDAVPHPLDEQFPEWGESPYMTVTLRHTIQLSKLLTHLYVLLPVLDDAKHYFVSSDEVQNLLRRGEGWLDEHPARELIARRFLKHRYNLAREALEQLVAEDLPGVDEAEEQHELEEAEIEAQISLNEQRMGAVAVAIKKTGATRVLDLGCGEGKLIALLMQDGGYRELVGMDVSSRMLDQAARKLRLDDMPRMQRERLTLMQGSLMYRDERLSGFDAAAVVEVIEHLDAPRLAAFESVVFEHAQPSNVVVTTPNREYNSMWESLPAGEFRHKDHRFEWTRDEFQTWASGVAERHGYGVRFEPVGPEDPRVGAPTQMGVFTR